MTLSKCNDIQNALEERLRHEETTAARLKARFAELTSQVPESDSTSHKPSEIEFGSAVNFKIDGSKFNKVIRSTATHADLVSASQLNPDHKHCGIAVRDDQDRLLWIRSNSDVRLIFTWYFAQEVPALQIVRLTRDHLAPIEAFALRKEAPYHEGNGVFRCECAGPEGVLIVLSVPSNLKFEGVMAYLVGIFGKITSLMFVDDANDIITLDSVDCWDYCMETAVAMAKSGIFPLLLVETAKK
jgi:hypothetical protein